MPFEHPPFSLSPMLQIVTMLMAALTVELIGQQLDFLSQLFRYRMLRLGCLSPTFVVMGLRHSDHLCVSTLGQRPAA